MELARFKRSRVKGHYVFKSESRPGDTFTCAREPGNPHSPDAIIVKLSDGSNVGHVPDPLARVLAPMLDGGEIERMFIVQPLKYNNPMNNLTYHNFYHYIQKHVKCFCIGSQCT